MNCSTPGLPVRHQLLESTQTHVQRVGDAIQPSHPLSSPSPPAFNLSQHQGKESEVAQSCLTLCHPTDCSLPGTSVPGIFQAIVLEWIAISFSRGSSQPRDQTQVSHIVDRRFTVWASQLFALGGHSIGVSASISVPPMNTQDRSPLGWTGWNSLQSNGLSRVFNCKVSNTTILWHLAFFIVQPSHSCITTGKTIALTRETFVSKVMSLLFNMLLGWSQLFFQGAGDFFFFF